MKHFLLLLLTAATVGCAGSAFDTDFRTKVAEVDPKVMVSYNDGDPTAFIGGRIILRDPTKTGTAK